MNQSEVPAQPASPAQPTDLSDEMVTVAIVDDHPMVRLGLSAMIAAERDLQAVGEAANGQEAVQMLQSMPPNRVPHVVLMDLMMPSLGLTRAVCVLSTLSQSVLTSCKVTVR